MLMGATNQTADDGSNIDERDVCETVRDALDNRIVIDIHVNSAEYLIAIEFGGQYRWETAHEIAREEVVPAIGDEWAVSGFTSPSTDVETHRPGKTLGLDILSVKRQQFGSVDVYGNVMGIVAGGLGSYIDERRVDTHDIPCTYSNWDEGWDDLVDASGAINGPTGVARNGHAEGFKYGWYPKYVKSALRILSGKGRFNSEEYQFHETVPFGVLESQDGAVIIAPCGRHIDGDEVADPDFEYGDDDGFTAKEIELLRGDGA